MALATQCPHCHTTFRVAHDQLKLRAGLVRCGACKQIFNGIENLLQPEELEQGQAAASIPVTPPAASNIPQEAAAPPMPAVPDHAEEPVTVPAQQAPTEEVVPASSAEASEEPPKDDPLLRMTLMDFAHARREPAESDGAEFSAVAPDHKDPVEQALDDLQSKPWRRKPDGSAPADGDALDQADAADYEEPSFVRQGRRRQRLGRALRIFMATASVLLLAVLLAQGAYIFRDQLAARFPKAQPILAQACAYLDCRVGQPAQIESVSIESSELQTLAADSNTFVLTILLRNRGATAQAWPNIELTLNDANEKPIARRVFFPRDYLSPAQDFDKGFAGGTEQPFKLYFELAQLKASGYRAYLFYP